MPVAELIRQVGISEQTLYRWKKQCKGLETDQVHQFKPLQEEEWATQAVGGGADVGQGDASGRFGTKTVTPSRRRPVVSYWHDAYRVSERRACRVARLAVSSGIERAGGEDGTAAADSRDRSNSSSLRLPESPGAAESRGLESGKLVYPCIGKKA